MLTRPRAAPRPYAFVAEGSAERFLDRIARAIADDPAAQAILDRPDAAVMSDLKARTKSSGKAAIKALYWSARCPDPDAFGGLRARTLLADPDQLRWIDLPGDPALPALADLAAQPGQWQMLRYVPLRRTTLLHHPTDCKPEIVKLKRPDRAREAAMRLRAAQTALGPDPGFGIPHLTSHDDTGTFRTSFCPGAPLSAGFPPDLRATLRRIGDIHARLHLAQPLGLPSAESVPAEECLALTAALMPGLADRLSPLADLLRDRPAPGPDVLCHGDLSAGQILRAGSALSVVDFDLCHAGDAAADIARFLVGLPDDLPHGADPAPCRATYLEGYAARRPLPGPDVLRWHCAQAVAERLLVLLRKDRAQPFRIERLLTQIDRVTA